MIGSAFLLLITFVVLSLPVAAALGLMAYVLSTKYAFFPLTGALGELAWSSSSDFILIALPMFIMMGELRCRVDLFTLTLPQARYSQRPLALRSQQLQRSVQWPFRRWTKVDTTDRFFWVQLLRAVLWAS